MSEQESVEALEAAAADTRNKRVDRLRAIVIELFPGDEARELREDIDRSFLVPQIGEYHNEGGFMDSHLELITKAIDQVARGEFPDSVPEFARAAMRAAVERDRLAVKKYVFLHDISKADCMTVKFGGDERAMSWEDWKAFLATDSDGEKALTGDEAALNRFVKTKGITSVSYMQTGTDGTIQHGDVGAEHLRAGGVSDDAVMLAAIETHEAAFQFATKEEDAAGEVRARADRYKKIFDGFSEEARDFAMLASYVDTMASLRANGEPNLTSFRALAVSRQKFETIPLLEARLVGAKLDKQKFQRAWPAFVNSPEPLSPEMLDAAEKSFWESCGLASYDIDALGVSSQTLVDAGILTAAERDQLLDVAARDPQSVGRVFGRKMLVLKPSLEAATKK